MDASTLARIEFRQEIGTFTDAERQALIGQLILAARNIHGKQWELVDVAEFSAPDDPPRLVVPS